MKKYIHTCVFPFVTLTLFSYLHAVDWIDFNMPSTITLNGGTRNDTITASKGNFEPSAIGDGKNTYLNIIGAPGSGYILEIQDPPNAKTSTTTFYSKGIDIGENIQVAFINTHTLAIQQRGINVGNGATLSVISSGNIINAAGSDYGGSSKVRFNSNTSLILGQNATADFIQAIFFIHDGNLTVNTNAKLNVQANTIRIQKNLSNNGGQITLNGNVYNIGSPVNLNTNGTATFQNHEGNITVVGNFYNGGQAQIDATGNGSVGFNVFDPPFGGGGQLLLYGGTMNVNGQITSTRGGSATNGGGLLSPQDSNIGIYGATLSATKLANEAGSTLTFGVYKGKMGVFNGNLENNGTIIVDFAGATDNSYTLVNGPIATNANVQIKNGNTEFASAQLSYGANNRWDGKATLTINHDAIKQFTNTLDSNQQAILQSLGNGIYTVNGSNRNSIKADIDEMNGALMSQFFTLPLSLIDMLKSNMKVDSFFINQYANTTNVEVGGIVSGISGSANGTFNGIKAGTHFNFLNSLLSLQTAYAYGSIQDKQRNFTLLQSTFQNRSHNIGFAMNVHSRFLANQNLELDILLGYFLSIIDSQRNMQINALQVNDSLSTNYIFQSMPLDTQLGYRFFYNNISLKPYLGLHQSYNLSANFVESATANSSLGSRGYDAYHLNLSVGLESRYIIDNNKHIALEFDYEHFLLNSQKLLLSFQDGSHIAFDSPYNKRISFHLTGQFAINNTTQLGFETFLKWTLSEKESFYHYGGNAIFRYIFSV
ncbi:hypothetical protein CQA66_07765 [Helicobacter aurati]|uniref:Autotransporter domain-containing protein n=1 Tax=Helicobacter aurati TaxID=137778 RepID=A0A3D8IZM9_9HELI|nr:hypothetical protein [Helicobacter aurati]RDU70727.1 hypothetical protein CQA66_07765 [Helicobacter aurati]